MSRIIGWMIAVLIAAGLGVIYYYQFADGGSERAEVQNAVRTQPPLNLPVPDSVGPTIRHPVPGGDAAAPGSAPLPPLKESDRAMQEGLGALFGPKPVADFLIPQNTIRRLVVTIDNLPRRKLAVELRPMKGIEDKLMVEQVAEDPATGAETAVLSAQNYARYQPLIQLVQAADAKQIAALYLRFYPLFQQAYEDLGYPGRYFNDRLVETIDHLLETPVVDGPISLVRPKVFYEFADPQLEARSSGQKLLIRMGPENAAIVKQKLTQLRAAVAGGNTG